MTTFAVGPIALFAFSGCGPQTVALQDLKGQMRLSYVNGGADFAPSLDVSLGRPGGAVIFDIQYPYVVAEPFTIGVLGKTPVAACQPPTCENTGLHGVSIAAADFTGGDFDVVVTAGSESASLNVADLGTLLTITAPANAAAADAIQVDIAPASFAPHATFKLTEKSATTFGDSDEGELTATLEGSTASIVIPAGTAAGDYFLTAIVDASALKPPTCDGFNSCAVSGDTTDAASVGDPPVIQESHALRGATAISVQ